MIIDKKAIRELLEWGEQPYSNRLKNVLELEEENLGEFNFKNLEDYSYRLQLSKTIQQDSNISIIDPDIETIEDLEAKFDSYNRLIYKFRIFSNNYSYQIWGYDVSTMYYKILSDIRTKEEAIDDDNLIMKESLNNKNQLYYDCILASGDYLSILKSNMFINLDKSIPIEEKRKYGLIKELDIAVPSTCPWFTVSEMINMNANYKSSENYYKAITETKDKDKLISLGWNPELNVNENTIDIAKRRQRWWFDKYATHIFDFTNENFEYINNKPEINSFHEYLPVFMITPDQLPTNSNTTEIFKNFAVSLLPNLNIVYTVNLDSNVFYGFKKEYKDILQDKEFTVSVVFFDKDTYNDLLKVLNAGERKYPIEIENVLFKILDGYGLSKNEVDLTIERVLFEIYIIFLYRLTSDSKLEYNPSCYKLFNGTLNDYNPNRIDNLMGIFYNKKIAANYSATTFHNFVDNSDREDLTRSIKEFMNIVCVPVPIATKIKVRTIKEGELELI